MTKAINIVRIIIMSILLILFLIFCFQNKEDVSIQFLNMHVEQMPLFLVLFVTLLFGLLIGFLAGMIKGSKVKREAERAQAISRDQAVRP
jgi:uncharacterized integral membrane protein